MDFTVGEKVRLLGETGYGIVKEILNSNFLLVETDYGFEIKKEINQIIKIYSEDYSQINENLHLSKNRNKSSLKYINKSQTINDDLILEYIGVHRYLEEQTWCSI